MRKENMVACLEHKQASRSSKFIRDTWWTRINLLLCFTISSMNWYRLKQISRHAENIRFGLHLSNSCLVTSWKKYNGHRRALTIWFREQDVLRVKIWFTSLVSEHKAKHKGICIGILTNYWCSHSSFYSLLWYSLSISYNLLLFFLLFAEIFMSLFHQYPYNKI